MAAYFRLQDLIKVTGTMTQSKREAIDVGGYRYLVVQGRVPKLAATSGTLYLQTAAVLEDEAFLDYDPTNINIDLTQDTNIRLVLIDPLRYLRWRGLNVNADASFLLDVIGR